MSIIELAKSAMEDLGIEPVIEPVRGGTDGSKISYLGFRHQIFLPVVKICMDAMNLFPWNQ